MMNRELKYWHIQFIFIGKSYLITKVIYSLYQSEITLFVAKTVLVNQVQYLLLTCERFLNWKIKCCKPRSSLRYLCITISVYKK